MFLVKIAKNQKYITRATRCLLLSIFLFDPTRDCKDLGPSNASSTHSAICAHSWVDLSLDSSKAQFDIFHLMLSIEFAANRVDIHNLPRHGLAHRPRFQLLQITFLFLQVGIDATVKVYLVHRLSISRAI